jgi:hypothetical protein
MESLILSRTYDFLAKQVNETNRIIRTYPTYDYSGYTVELSVWLDNQQGILKVRGSYTNEFITTYVGNISDFILYDLCHELNEVIRKDNNLWIKPNI